MIDLKRIRYFIACVEKMGFQLFERHSRGISLTEDGKLLYQYA